MEDKLLDKYIREKVEELVEEEREKIKQEVRQELKQEMEGDEADINIKQTGEKMPGMSRRDFLKKAGLGAAGIGAMALTPASALDIKDENFSVQTGTDSADLQEYFKVSQGGPVNIRNTDFIIENTDNDQVLQIPVYESESDLPEKSEGSIAYVQETDEIMYKTE